MLCGGYSILLLHVFRYFLEQNRGFALKMVSDVRDGFIDANKSRTSRLHCGVHRPFYTHPRNYTRTQSATHNKWHVQYKHNSAIPCLFIFGSDCTYSSLPSSDLRFLWPWGTLSITWTPWSLAEIKRCSEQPTAFCRARKTVTDPHWLTRCVVLSYCVLISVPVYHAGLFFYSEDRRLGSTETSVNIYQATRPYTPEHAVCWI